MFVTSLESPVRNFWLVDIALLVPVKRITERVWIFAAMRKETQFRTVGVREVRAPTTVREGSSE